MHADTSKSIRSRERKRCQSVSVDSVVNIERLLPGPRHVSHVEHTHLRLVGTANTCITRVARVQSLFNALASVSPPRAPSTMTVAQPRVYGSAGNRTRKTRGVASSGSRGSSVAMTVTRYPGHCLSPSNIRVSRQSHPVHLRRQGDEACQEIYYDRGNKRRNHAQAFGDSR